MNDESVEWTTDMKFPVGNDFDLKDVSIFIKNHFELSMDFIELHKNLCNKFALTEDDSSLAIERAIGGIVRALTTNLLNEPNSLDDPIANYMFLEVWESMPTKGIFKKRKIASGKWCEWNNKRCDTFT
jgi:hypothetical protein